MAQSVSFFRLFPHPNETPSPDDFILRRYPVMWQGNLILKKATAAVQMHFVSGNPVYTRLSLPPITNGESAPIKIHQRMRLDQSQLDSVYRKIQQVDEHCILMALPCGKDHDDLAVQASNLKFDIINYLLSKNAAGITYCVEPGTDQPGFFIHLFPACEFIQNNLSKIAPHLLHRVHEIPHLTIIITTV